MLCIGSLDSFGQLDTSAQKAKATIDRFSNQMLRSVERKYHKLEDRLTHYSERSLQQLEKQEGKLQKKLVKKDSAAASQFFANTKEKYTGILQKLKNPAAKLNSSSLNHYLPGLDSLQTTFSFLDYDQAEEIPTTISGTAVFTINPMTDGKDGKKMISQDYNLLLNLQKGQSPLILKTSVK